MHSAGARALREDDNEMSREAVLLQWERKIEAAERRDDERRFVRTPEHEAAVEQRDQDDVAPAEPVPLRPVDERPQAAPSRRFERRAPVAAEPLAGEPLAGEPAAGVPAAGVPAAERPVAERRTITITGQPTPARRRRAVVDAQLAQPDRIALWAFLLGLLLVAVAAGTAHA
jgi:hypothetical protein